MKTSYLQRTIYFSFISLLSVWNFAISGCSDLSTESADPLPVKPVVKVTNTDYSREIFYKNFPDSTSLNSICKAYSGKNFSEEIKVKLNSYIMQQASSLGEDTKILNKILSAMGCNLTGEYILPTYVEKAKYEGNNVWIVQVTWEIGNPGLGHYRCLVYGAEKLDTLAWVACK